jgi:hypothetical protein
MAESSIARPSLLWKHMSPDRRRQAAEAFWSDENGAAEQAQAVTAIAQHLKFRTKSVAVLSAARKIQYLLALPVVPETVASRLLVSYHFDHQRPIMAAFLDALGVAHDNGMLAEDSAIPEDPDRIRAAAKTLAESFPAEDVTLYLSTLWWQDPGWGVLADLSETSANRIA